LIIQLRSNRDAMALQLAAWSTSSDRCPVLIAVIRLKKLGKWRELLVENDINDTCWIKRNTRLYYVLIGKVLPTES